MMELRLRTCIIVDIVTLLVVTIVPSGKTYGKRRRRN